MPAASRRSITPALRAATRESAFLRKTSLGRRGDRAGCEIDTFGNCDNRDHIIATLRETKAKLSEMVKLAANGEEVFITVHGKQMAKLVGLPKRARKLDKEKWLAKLARLRRQTGTGIVDMTAQEIQDEDRAERF